tara:strand:- start:405 stop:959 length:555 start_codon:yes stop_codon:yes gene_type:complete
MKYFILISSLILFIFSPTLTFSNDFIVSKLQSGGNIVFIRHALAPGSGDPENINLNDCSTQRNLNETGIEQSKKIGEFFKKNNIPVDIVLSSAWCRCKDTAKYAFHNYEIFNALNSFYDEKFYKFKDKQIQELRMFIKNWNSNKNLVLITHFVVVSEILNTSLPSGGLAIATKDLKIIGTIELF